MQKTIQGNLHGKQASRAEAEKKKEFTNISFCFLLFIVLRFGLLLYIVVINTGSHFGVWQVVSEVY